MKQKIQEVLAQLNHGLIEREETIKIALLTVLAGENLVLIGPPGTGKSMIARRIADSLEGDGGYFEYLLTKFSTPEEIFGPLSITELKKDRFKRNTAGYLPSVQIAFLDEIFKASSSILNSLLTILNERIFHNGAESEKVPLRSLISASNELPTDQEELNALYDRFLVRSFVDYVCEENLHRLFESENPAPSCLKLSRTDLDSIQASAQQVAIPAGIIEVIRSIWKQHKTAFKEDRREMLSDRRLKKNLWLLRVSAATNGRREVDLSDVVLLKNCLWNHPDNARKVLDIIVKTLEQNSHLVLQGTQDIPCYEVAEDGETMVSVNQPAALPAVRSQAPMVRTGNKPATVIKGFKGSGTELDPILIETVADLMDISRPDVGVKGYYFLQTSDIDCSEMTHWPKIDFQGFYDGGGHTITIADYSLFDNISSSSIFNLKVQCQRLANKVDDSTMTCCHSTGLLVMAAAGSSFDACSSVGSFVDNAHHCQFIKCSTEKMLINKAEDCQIAQCQAQTALVNEAKNCGIRDSVVVYAGYSCSYIDEHRVGGGIVNSITDGVVERCFVTGEVIKKTTTSSYFGGIAGQASPDTLITLCAVGTLLLKDCDSLDLKRVSRVAHGGRLENNAVIDTVRITSGASEDANGEEGRTVAAAGFTQRFLEYTLGWDFDTIWVWDDANKRPALRELTIPSGAQKRASQTGQAATADLLYQQLRANIWL